MVYTPNTKKAINLAFEAHNGQKDKSGLPYILHPIHLAEQMETEEECIVAILHDVVEDTPVTLGDLVHAGFSDTVVNAVELLTRKKGVEYMDYIDKLKENPIARKVKLADLAHNSDPTRLEKLSQKDRARNEKYQRAVEILNNY